MENSEDLITLPEEAVISKIYRVKGSESEFENLRSQIVTSSWGGMRYQPYAFTEQGVAMLSGILHSVRAIQVNIAIMRAFVQLLKPINQNK